MIQISVRDTGIGIKKEDHKKLFKLFGFLENSKDLNSKGVGLGLHISQQITQEFGGKILLDSDIGQGAKFTFLIDLDQKNAGAESEVKRHLNPSRKEEYPKLIIQRPKN